MTHRMVARFELVRTVFPLDFFRVWPLAERLRMRVEDHYWWGVAKPGKAPGFGPGIRRFESCLPSAGER